MNRKRNVILWMLVLLVIAVFPLWYTLAKGKPGPAPELELPTGETRCVEEKGYMTARHMELLDVWRDAVVRDGEKTYTSRAYGTTHEMSLTRTCMECHTKRETFCTRCHDYAHVRPYCWDCHLERGEL